MTRDEVRASAARVVRWHRRFAPLFGRREAQEHSLDYLKGLFSDQPRKSVEPIALPFARSPNGEPATQKEVVAMQNFISVSPWEAGDIFREIQAVFAEEMEPSCQQWSLGTVGVIDESGFVKQPAESVGVDRQWCGRLGKTANCPVGVYLVGVTPAGTAMLDAQLFLPEDRAKDGVHRKKTRVPKEVPFQSKPQIAATITRRTQAAGKVRFDWMYVEEYFEDGKMHLGMAHYEVRSWAGWHHHMSLVALARLFVTLNKRDLKEDKPELTLDMAVQLLRSAFARRMLTEDDAIRLIEYHLDRNRIAHDSHRKSWLAKHNRAKPEVLL